jgi:mono/diheme cytochrome c family protein
MKTLSPDFHGHVILARHRGIVKRAVLFVLPAIVLVCASVFSGAPYPALQRVPAAAAPGTAAQRGRLVYDRYGCAMCHGPEGKGGFANQNAETDGRVPGVVRVAEGYTSAEVKHLMLAGRPTVGKASASGPRPPYRMPGWQDSMTAQETDDLVAYLMGLAPKSAGTKWR